MQLMEVQLVKMQLMEVQLLWLVLCSAAPLRAVGEIVDLKYNIADLKQFGIEHPFIVKGSDIVRISCAENLTASIFLLKNIDEFKGCYTVASKGKTVARCESQLGLYLSLSIVKLSATLKSTPSYEPGGTYYFASFEREKYFKEGENISGGLCSENLKFVLYVSLPSEIRITTTTTTTNAQNEPNTTGGIRPSTPNGLGTTFFISAAATGGGIVLICVIFWSVTGMCCYRSRQKRKLMPKTDSELSRAKTEASEKLSIKNGKEIKRDNEGEILKSDLGMKNETASDGHQLDANKNLPGCPIRSKEKDQMNVAGNGIGGGMHTQRQGKTKSVTNSTTSSAATSGNSSVGGRTAGNKQKKKPLPNPQCAKNNIKSTPPHLSSIGSQPPSNRHPLSSSKAGPARAPPQHPTGRLSSNVISSLRTGQGMLATTSGRDKGL